jgi:hypothetical protein
MVDRVLFLTLLGLPRNINLCWLGGLEGEEGEDSRQKFVSACVCRKLAADFTPADEVDG